MITALTADTINSFSDSIVNFLFILIRVSIFISLLPVFSGRQLPIQFKLGLAVFMSLLLTPIVNVDIAENSIPLLVIKEVVIAMALGLAVRFIFLAVNMAGTFVSYTMGLSVAQVFNPEIGQSTLMSETYGVLTMLIFLAMDAHHDLIFIFVKSFEMLPLGTWTVGALLPEIISMGSGLFVLALKIGAPVMVGVLMVHLLSGFLYKAAPQMNIFFIALPLNIFLGMLLTVLSIPAVEYVLGINFSNLREDMTRLIMMARG